MKILVSKNQRPLVSVICRLIPTSQDDSGAGDGETRLYCAPVQDRSVGVSMEFFCLSHGLVYRTDLYLYLNRDFYSR